MSLWEHLQDMAPQEILVEQKLFSECHLGHNGFGTQLFSWSNQVSLDLHKIWGTTDIFTKRIQILRFLKAVAEK